MISETTVWIADTEFDGVIKKANLISIFNQLASHDEDFNGNNGEEYLWEEAEEQGYECNADFLINKVLKDVSDDEDLDYGKVRNLIDTFLFEWTGHDDYYGGVDFDFYDKNNVLFVAVAVAREN